MSVQSKNQIKNRMVKKAAELWGVSPNDIESTFDPVVSLLIGACASELFKISNEINDSRTRITEKLIELMSPEAASGALPAHAVAYAMPVEDNAEIFPANQLFTKKRSKNADGEVSLKNAYFSPLTKFKLIKSHIKYALVSNKVIEFEDDRKVYGDDMLMLNDGLSSLGNSTMYLGFTPTTKKVSLKNVSLFFELNDVSYKDLFYNQLKQAEFYFNDKKVEVEFGFVDNNKEDRVYLKKLFNEQSQKSILIENQVLTSYKRHFVSIKSDCLLNGKTNSEVIEKVDLNQHDDFANLHWLKIVFPSTINNKLLTKIYTTINAFPVLNRRLESTTYQLKEFTNIIPFSSNDLFLNVRKISNENGKEYKLKNDESANNKGTYYLRDKSVNRLDSKRAKDHLLHLIELLKNESAAFSVIGNDFLQSNIQKLNQNISVLEAKVEEMSVDFENNHYLTVKPYTKKETLFIDFWSTIGEHANLIKPNTSLQVYKGADLDSQKCFLLTPTIQGKNSLSVDERLLKYRRSLLSRDRIVTREDIKALCYDICGNKIDGVTLKKQFITHIEQNKGLIPTFLIQIKKSKSVKLEDLEWEMIKNNILSILEEKSTNLLPYQIELN